MLGSQNAALAIVGAVHSRCSVELTVVRTLSEACEEKEVPEAAEAGPREHALARQACRRRKQSTDAAHILQPQQRLEMKSNRGQNKASQS